MSCKLVQGGVSCQRGKGRLQRIPPDARGAYRKRFRSDKGVGSRSNAVYGGGTAHCGRLCHVGELIVRCLTAVAAALMMLALPLGGCSEKPNPNASESVAVMGASVRTNPNASAPWAAYFTLLGGAEDRVLTGVTADGAGRAELHESRMEGGLMTMASLTDLSIPAGGEVVFRQGGKHVMLFDVTPEARAAGRMTATLSFDDGSRLPVELAFAPEAAAEAASNDDHAEHQGH